MTGGAGAGLVCSARLAAIPAGWVIDAVVDQVRGAHQPVNVVVGHAVRLDQQLDLRVDRPGPGRLHLGLVPADIPHVGGLAVEIVQLVVTRLAQDKALPPSRTSGTTVAPPILPQPATRIRTARSELCSSGLSEGWLRRVISR